MCNIIDCEETPWILGTTGVCNNVTNLCICPLGYTGEDLLNSFNDCHVSISGRRMAAITMVASSSLTLILMLVFGVRVGAKYRHALALYKGGMDRSPSSQVSVTGAGGDMTFVRNIQETQKIRRNVHLRHRAILLVYGLFVVSIVSGLPFQVGLLLEEPMFRYTVPVLLDLTLGLMFSTFFCGFGIVCYLCYTTLPNVPAIGTLLGIDSIFVKYPNFIYRLTIFEIFFTAVSHILIWGVFPHLENASPSNKHIVEDSQIVFILVLSVAFDILLIAVVRLILKLFNHALEASGHKGDIMVRRLKRAQQNAKGILILIVTTPFKMVLLIYMLTQDGQRVWTVLFPALYMLMNFTVLVCCFFLSRELTSAPKTEERTMSAGVLTLAGNEASTASFL